MNPVGFFPIFQDYYLHFVCEIMKCWGKEKPCDDSYLYKPSEIKLREKKSQAKISFRQIRFLLFVQLKYRDFNFISLFLFHFYKLKRFIFVTKIILKRHFSSYVSQVFKNIFKFFFPFFNQKFPSHPILINLECRYKWNQR